MDTKEEREQKAALSAQFGAGNLIFVKTKWTGLLAFQRTPEERYLDYFGSMVAPLESSGIAQEQFVVDCLAHPTDDGTKAKLRRTLKAMPGIATEVAQSIEMLSCGDFVELEFSDDEKKKLDAKWEFGWGGLIPEGHAPIVLATDEMAGMLVRIANDARANGDNDNGRKIRSAVLGLVRSPDQETVEALLAARPALLVPLWNRTKELVGVGIAEVGKG
jgi:hypothetical protein